MLTNFSYRKLLPSFFGLPVEIQVQIISRLSIPSLLNLRLASKQFCNLVASNESQLVRYHVTNTLPHRVARLYPPPAEDKARLHYLCSILHRLNVASKLADLISEHVTKEIFLRTTEEASLHFQPQQNRMRQRLMRRMFTIFHFFERYRELHVNHLISSGTPLSKQAFTINPFERIILEGYPGDDLIEAHEVFPLVISSCSRRLRPPPYASRLERPVKYVLDRPADEVHSTILFVGGLRHLCAVWAIKGYNARRMAVDTWYNLLSRKPAEAVANSRKPTIRSFPYLARKSTPSISLAGRSHSIGDEKQWCHPWYCVRSDCPLHSGQSGNLPSTRLSEGPPMRSLSKGELQLFLADLPHLSNIWIPTAEAVILDRGIRERPQDIKRNTQVLLDLIREDATDLDESWEDMLLDPRIEMPSTRGELHSVERVSLGPQLPAAEHLGDATAIECVLRVERSSNSNPGPSVDRVETEDATHLAEQSHSDELQQTELSSSEPTESPYKTTAAIKPKLSLSGLSEDIEETKRSKLSLIHQASQSDAVVVDSEELPRAEADHDSATTRNTLPEDVVMDPRLSDLGSKLSNLKLMFYMIRDVFLAGVYLLQKLLGSGFDTWSHLWRSKTEPPAGMSRVKWKCVSISHLH